jgi:hypothetical protein
LAAASVSRTFALVKHIAVTECGLALVFLGRSFTRIYVRRAVAQFGADAIAFARMPESDVVPAWVSFVFLSGWVITAVASVWPLIA